MRPSFTIPLALAYASTGWLSLHLLSLPTGNVAAVFPAAGIALAALLIFGNRVWPGVLLGALALQALSVVETGTDARSLALVAIPAGATLQALAGAWLARRLVGFPNALDTPGSIVRFLGVVTPVSCLVGASIAVPVLVSDARLPGEAAAFSWWGWWLGDALGVMLAAPLMFVLFGEPRESWRPRRRTVAAPLAAATVLAGLVFHQVSSTEELRVRAQFYREAENLASLVRNRLDAQIDMLLAVERFMTLRPDASREEFHRFVAPLLQRRPGTQNFTWNPLVASDERERFEAAVAASGVPAFRVLDRVRASEGATLPAGEAGAYLPILYVEPMEGNAQVVGLNPLSIPAAAPAMRRTETTGEPAASDGFRLTQETGQQRGVVVYQAVFGGPEASSPRLLGMVSAAFRMDDALGATIDRAAALKLELCLIDLNGSEGNSRLSGAPDCEKGGWARTGLHQTFQLDFADRRWEIRLRGASGYAADTRSTAAWTSAPIGAATVGILSAFLLVGTGQTQRVARLVEERTGQLAAASAELLEQQTALARAQRIAGMGSWEMDPRQDLVQCSDEFRALLALPASGRLSPLQIHRAILAADREPLSSTIVRLMSQPGSAALDCRLRDDPARIMHFVIESEWRDGKLHRVRGTVQDVTRTRDAEAHIQRLAHYDSLTGLPNRNLWMMRAEQIMHAARRHGDTLAVLFLDLDQFKTVNDSLGHTVGDGLLAAAAQRLISCIREEDVLARLGGDEFVALLPRLGRSDDAAMVARKLLDVLTDPIEIQGHELNPSVSIGISVYPADGEDIDTLLKHADLAMYSAKAAGRNNFQFFVPEMNARAYARWKLENGLRRAIARDELTLHYQPQIDAAAHRVAGVEALVRWNHAELGLVTPDRFIPVAEESGLIVPLGEWVLKAACREQVRWRSEGHTGLMMAVNISALQFRKPEFVQSVANALQETGADPRCLELEITESALMEPSDALFEQFERLAAMGVALALDDFGTGYSSLSYLKRLPLRRLKLDRSFVKDLPGDPEDAAIASATLSMARDLGLEFVAEGVETPEQRDFLMARGCRLMQGYLFSRPLEADALKEWLTARG